MSATAACGFDCSTCDAYQATKANDAEAIRKLAEQASAHLGRTVDPASGWCDGCMAGGPRVAECCGECEVRACVRGRGFATCAECGEYVCAKLEPILPGLPGAKETLEALRRG